MDHAESLERAPTSTPSPVTDRAAWPDFDCPVDGALSVMGTRSAVLLLREAFFGTRRFQDFAERVGISEAVAATRLRALVADGLLRKVPYRLEGDRVRQEYRLTEKGRDLLPVIVALMRWGDRWVLDGAGALDLIHDACGAEVHAELRCRGGHDVPTAELRVRPGPGMPPGVRT